MRKILTTALACAFMAGAAPAFAGDLAVIQALNDQWCADGDRGDAHAIAGLYSADATVLPPNNLALKGPAIESFFAGVVTGVDHLKLTATDVQRLAPDFLREIGTASLMTKGDKPETKTATYVVIWRKEGETWRMWTQIFH